jgi:anaphase-promoting complex subunit 1
MWPCDVPAILAGKLNGAEQNGTVYDALAIAKKFNIKPSMAWGLLEALPTIKHLLALYNYLSDSTVGEPKRGEHAVGYMVGMSPGPDMMIMFPLGVALPLREACRTYKLIPPSTGWSLTALEAVGRHDMTAGARFSYMSSAHDGYRSVKDYIVSCFTTVFDRV